MIKFLIGRPIAVLMTTLGIIILGFYASSFIPVSLMPDIDIPEITVQVSDENMSARQLENSVVRRLRLALKQVSHLEDIKSETTNGIASIKLRFVHGTEMDYSFIEVNEKIDRIIGSLPKEMKRPKVIKASATDIPVFYLSMTLKNGKEKNKARNKALYPVSQEFTEFSRFSNEVIKRRLEQIPEVAMVDVSGLVASEILVQPDLQKLHALQISLDALEGYIQKANVSIKNLSIKDNQYQYNIRLGSQIKSIKDIEDLYIKKGDRVYQLKDLATIIEHPQKRKGLVLSDGKDAITMVIIKQSDAKMGDLKDKLNGLLEILRKDYKNIDFKVTRSQTKLLDFAISNLFQSLLWGILLSFLIMFLFLKNLKSPVLIATVIPISMIVCLLLFQALNISINIISLSGLALCIGLMIDNSIIVIDNISQYYEQGNSITKSCVLGTNEVFRPLVSSALTTCAVFVPLIFISGIAGTLFYDQAMAITIGLFTSLLVSILLLPVLYYLFHKKDEIKKGRVSRFLESVNSIQYEHIYESGLKWVLRRQKLSWLIVVLLLLTAGIFYKILPKAEMPYFTEIETLLQIDWNEQVNVDENKRRVLQLLEAIKNQTEEHTALVGTQQFVLDKDALARTPEVTLYLNYGNERSKQEGKQIANKFLHNNFPDASYQYKKVDNIFSTIFSKQEAPLIARMRNVGSIDSQKNNQLKDIWHLVKNNMNLELEPIVWQESILLIADREKMLIYNVTENSIYNKLESAFGEREIFNITYDQDVVRVVLGENLKTIKEVLNETAINLNDGTAIHIKEFLKAHNVKELKNIIGGREGEYYPLNFDISLNDVSSTKEKVKHIVNSNKWYEVNFAGSYFTNKKTIKELIMILLLSLVLLYFILASQFESFVLPLIILFEVPIDLAGSFLLLYVFDMSINLMSLIGIVVMSGIIINDSILKIDTIIHLHRKGAPVFKAIMIAGQRRLKPILMTSLTTILALAPILFYSGIGAELQSPLAVSLIGGMVLGTIVSLYFIPLSYYYLASFNKNCI